MWELYCKEGWELKNWCFRTVALEKTLESHLDCKEIQLVHPKGNQSWILIEGADPEAEAPMLWPPDAKSQLIGKDPDAGQNWRWKKGTTGWGGWMALLTQWTWSWASSKRWWRTEKPGVLQFMGSQRVRHDLATEKQQILVTTTHLLLSYVLQKVWFCHHFLGVCCIFLNDSSASFGQMTQAITALKFCWWISVSGDLKLLDDF